MTSHNDPLVFMNDEYLYGIRARVNAGLGLSQLACGSKETLNQANCAAARAAMMNFRAQNGRILGIRPTTLVVPPDLENAALRVLNITNGCERPVKPLAEYSRGATRALCRADGRGGHPVACGARPTAAPCSGDMPANRNAGRLLREEVVNKGTLGRVVHLRPSAKRLLKTDAAERLMPLHSGLVEMLAAGPDLFPNLSVDDATKRFALLG